MVRLKKLDDHQFTGNGHKRYFHQFLAGRCFVSRKMFLVEINETYMNKILANLHHTRELKNGRLSFSSKKGFLALEVSKI